MRVEIPTIASSFAPARRAHTTARGNKDKKTMEALARAVMTQIPPNAIDRQRVCEVIGRAELARHHGRHKDAARMLCDVGAALFRLGREEAMKIAEQAFQRAVERANTPDEDAPEYMKIPTEGMNSDLADAYAHLGNCERALGKMVDAEGHYKASARAVEHEGLEAHANKFVHRVMVCRLRKEFERHEAMCDAWEDVIRRAAKDGAESQTALLAATGICLQERAGGMADRGMFREAAELRGGKFLETVIRMQAHGLRAKPDVLLPNVYDSIAALYLRAKDTKRGLGFLYRAVASTACTERYGDKYVPEGEARGLRAETWDDVCWHPSLLVSKKQTTGEDSGEEEDVVPRRPWEVSAEEKKIVEQLLASGDKWTMKKGKAGPEPARGANAIGHILFALGNQLMVAEKWDEAVRPMQTACAMLQNDLDMQGSAFHLLGVIHFQFAKRAENRDRYREILPKAANAFALSADCRVDEGKCTKKGAAEAIDSLLFLGRCMFELGEPQQAEQVTAQAISIGRQVLGDDAKETNGAIRSMMELKRQMGR